MQKMYFFDIDGTLAYPGEGLISEVITQLKRLIKKVTAENVVFVTGTSLEKAVFQLKDTILDTGVTLFASMGGVEVRRKPNKPDEIPHRPCWDDVKSLLKLKDVDLEEWNTLQEKYRDLKHDLRFLAKLMAGTSSKTFQICTDPLVVECNKGKGEKNFIDETRRGMVTFRTVDKDAETPTRDAYKNWEAGSSSLPPHPLRAQIANFLRHRHPDFFFTVSGSTSIDILWRKKEGLHVCGQKDEILKFLEEDGRLREKKLIFVADETQSNEDGIGNDHLLAEAILRRQGVVYTVDKPAASGKSSPDTMQFLKSQLKPKKADGKG